jgi:hypothetical protein
MAPDLRETLYMALTTDQSQWPCGVAADRSNTGFVDSNPTQGVWCCLMYAEALRRAGPTVQAVYQTYKSFHNSELKKSLRSNSLTSEE